MLPTIRINYRKLANQIVSLARISEKNKWSYDYDSDLDQVYFAPKFIDKKYNLISISDEYSLYLDEKSNLGGIFIEYALSNLMVHDKRFKQIKQLFLNKKQKKITKDEKAIIISLFEAALSEIVVPKINCS